MMQWLKRQNIFLMILSVIAAMLLWSYVIYIENPDKTKTFNNINVIMNGVQNLTTNNLMITSGGDPTISIDVKGKRDRINNLQADMIDATVSVSHITVPGEHELNYTVNINDNAITINNKEPRQIKITVEKVEKKTVPIVFVQTGTPAENHTVESVKFAPDGITIEGAQSVVDQITQAIVSDNFDGATDSFEKSMGYILADANGDPVDTELLRRIDNPSVTMNVNMQMEYEVSLGVNFIATEYLSDDMVFPIIEPATITIVGPPDIIETVNNIFLTDISLKYVVENNVFQIERPITIPNGVSAMPGTPEVASVKISIPGYERREMTFDISVLPESEEYDYVQSDFTIALFGKIEDLDLLEEKDFTFTVAALPEDAEGQRSLALTVEVAARDIEILNKNVVVVKVTGGS